MPCIEERRLIERERYRFGCVYKDKTSYKLFYSTTTTATGGCTFICTTKKTMSSRAVKYECDVMSDVCIVSCSIS